MREITVAKTFYLANRTPDVQFTRSFYRTLAAAEIDLLLEIPNQGLWAIEIKRSLSARPEKGFHIACEDLKPERRFVVNAGFDRYPIDKNTAAIGLPELARMLREMRI